MALSEALFVTRVYRAEMGGAAARRRLLAELDQVCRSMADEDGAGRAWCVANGYPGYTSYASLNDLPQRFPPFAELVEALDEHVAAFARLVDFDLQGRALALDSLWVNVLPSGGYHTAHIHPHAAVSGTLYVAVPKGAAGLKLEDPRLAAMMAAPPRRARARRDNQTFATVVPKPGTLLLWESWLRHEVPPSRARDERISISFNYRWG